MLRGRLYDFGLEQFPRISISKKVIKSLPNRKERKAVTTRPGTRRGIFSPESTSL